MSIQRIKAKTLEWGETSDQKLTQEACRKWCERRGGGYRMPTISELVQARDDGVKGFKREFYWSASVDGPSNAYFLKFPYGNVCSNTKSFKNLVRCVREIEE